MHFPILFRIPEVDVDLQISFQCFSSEPDIELATDVDVDVDFPWYVDVATAGLSWVFTTVANQVIDNLIDNSEAIKAEILAKINEAVDLPLTSCPVFNVTSGGDVELIFGQGSECTDGQTKHRGCSSKEIGPGYDDRCINGYWETVGGWCAPPGGQQP